MTYTQKALRLKRVSVNQVLFALEILLNDAQVVRKSNCVWQSSFVQIKTRVDYKTETAIIEI